MITTVALKQKKKKKKKKKRIVDVQQIGEALLDSLDDCDKQCPSEGNNNNNYYSLDPINESVSSKEPTVLPPAPVAFTVDTYQLKSTLAKNVSQVLGETNEVMRFDKLRTNLKTLGTTQAKEDYEVALAAIQTRVLAKHATLKQQFKEWERCFFAKHKCKEPNLEKIRNDKTAHDLYKTLRLCKQLLKHWNITVNL